MITLLASVFFSGFIMSLNMFSDPVKVVSWLLPATYGTYLLRDIALNGSGPDWANAGRPVRLRPGANAHFLVADAPPDFIAEVNS